MTDNDTLIPNAEFTPSPLNDDNEPMALDDARRVRVLSPGTLVFKRFIRNKLAVVGLVILTVMFIFSFLGPLLSPYEQTQVFKGIGEMTKDYASAIYNTELRYTVQEGENFGAAERAQFLLALGKNQTDFSAGSDSYAYVLLGEGSYLLLKLNPIAEALIGNLRSLTGQPLEPAFTEAFNAAFEDKQEFFSVDGINYRIVQKGKTSQVATIDDIALATLNVFDAYTKQHEPLVNSYEFKLASTQAIAEQKSTFKVQDAQYTLIDEDGLFTVVDDSGTNIAEVSNIIVNPLEQSLFLDISFKKAIREAIANRENKVSYTDSNGNVVEYVIDRVNTNYYIKTSVPTELISIYEAPSSKHPLGLDNNGMDVMTRLMYGGRVSLLVGFVVIFIELFIGVIVGGISGYFGGWVDTSLMRFVDLFNSIPFYPMVLIFGSVMDALEVPPMTRIFLLMAILGLLGWTGIARVVRGQILSLREQDFMVATEATGIRTSRRIFRHLVPNVMPLLIVQATAGLGGIIISEATLGFLGLGVKYPLASWGSIINVASDAFVMTNYWFMWLPAGSLILLTVLGFNFVGDGLRDAFDPKMKR